MSLDKNYAQPQAYSRGSIPPTNLIVFLQNELVKLEVAIKNLNLLIPQAADHEPDLKVTGMQRYALHATWDPLGSGADKWVYWNGTAWVAL